jgi:hypothetical protein
MFLPTPFAFPRTSRVALCSTALLLSLSGCAKKQPPTETPDGAGTEGGGSDVDRMATSTGTRPGKHEVKGVTQRLSAKRPARDPEKPRGERAARKPLSALEVGSFSPTSGAAGTTVEIFGAGFVEELAKNKVKVGGVAWTVEEALTDRLLVLVPENAKDGVIEVTVGKRTVKSAEKFVFVADGPVTSTNGLLGAVFDIPDGASEMPDFTTLGEPVGTVALGTIDVAPRPAANGFPGTRLADASFAIVFGGFLNIVEAGEYDLCLSSDDGSQLALEGQVVVDNGSAKTAPAEVCQLVFLEAGEYLAEVRYFNAGDSDIALQLAWAKDGGAKEIIPESVLFRPDGPA